MNQPTFADLDYESKKRKTRREKFLERMDGLIPWEELEERIRPFYPKAGRGRRPYELSVMLRIHCVQLFYNLSDPGIEDMLYEVESVRRFVGLRLPGPLPDETTILNFRHLLEEHELGAGLFEEINRYLESKGLRLQEGTIVDASIIAAPSSTKNRAKEPPPVYAPAPATLTATALGEESADLSWSSVTGASGYHVQRRASGGGERWSTVDESVTGTSRTVTGLWCGRTHEFRVGAYGDGTTYNARAGLWSPTETATTAACSPLPPRFRADSYSFEISALAAVGDPVGTVSAIDLCLRGSSEPFSRLLCIR